MARKQPAKQSPESRAIADRVERARKANPPRDYLGCHELSKATKIDFDEVADFYEERAAIREYDGNVTRDQAEEHAMVETTEYFTTRVKP